VSEEDVEKRIEEIRNMFATLDEVTDESSGESG